MNPESLHERLDAWREGRLSAEDITALEQELRENPDAVREATDRRLVHELMEAAIAQDLRQRFRAATPDTPPVRTLQPWIRNLVAAAAILLLVVAGTGYWFTRDYDHNLMAQNHWSSVAEPGSTSRGQDATNTAELQEAQRAYRSQQFSQALQLYQVIPSGIPQHAEAQYGEALSLLRLGEEEAARNALEACLTPDHPRRFDAQWTLLGLDLVDGDDETILHRLDRIIQDPGNPYKAQAQELRDKVNSPWYRLVN